MKHGHILVLMLGLVGCGAEPDDSSAPPQHDTCARGAGLSGAVYDLAKSKFAFGSKPVSTTEQGVTHWKGDQGALAIWADGSELAGLNAGSPETDVADWSNDPDALAAHVRSYFVAMGVAECQIENSQVLGATNGRTIALAREVDGIPIAESQAGAHFNAHDLSTIEDFYWPALPANVIADARSFHDRLADPDELAMYKASLPDNAQGEGQVIIHHASAGSGSTEAPTVSYDVLIDRSTFSFRPDGQPIVGLQ
jgi:hypothetical protein